VLGSSEYLGLQSSYVKISMKCFLSSAFVLTLRYHQQNCGMPKHKFFFFVGKTTSCVGNATNKGLQLVVKRQAINYWLLTIPSSVSRRKLKFIFLLNDVKLFFWKLLWMFYLKWNLFLCGNWNFRHTHCRVKDRSGSLLKVALNGAKWRRLRTQ
jgi:hypothetical protein